HLLSFVMFCCIFFFFFSSRRRHTRSKRDWSSDVCSSDLVGSYFSGFSSMRDTSDAYKELRSANSNKPSANSQQPDNHSNPTEQDGHPQNGNASTIEGQNETNCGDPIDAITGSQKIVQTEFIIHDLTGDFPVQRSYESIYT